MITEETIKQTRFFKGLDEKLYLVSQVKGVILVTLIGCSDGKESQLILGDDACCRFAPVDVRFQSINNRKGGGEVGYKKPATVQGGKKASSSRFKGVKKSKNGYADGRNRYEVQYYDSVKKKLVYLGTFDNEYLAAAAYQERAGDKAEAARLRDLADMTIDESRKKTGKVYRCKHCKLEFQKKPESCPGCNSAAFDEIADY